MERGKISPMKLLYFAAVRERLKMDGEEVFLASPMTVAEIFDRHLAARLAGVEFSRLLFAVNEEMAGPDTVAQNTDTVAVMSPLSGGAALARIQAKDFDMAAETRLCAGGNSAVGGIATFVGRVRDNAKGKTIERIEIGCYESMALKELEKVRAEAVGKFAVINVTVVHRIGVLHPGEQIVGIVAAAGHRDAAFAACRYAIDELKKRVPIWKKEFTANGGFWVDEI